MKYLVKIFLFLICFELVAQDGIIKDNLCIYMDYGRFRYDEENTYLEIYYSVIDVESEVDKKQQNCRILFELENVEKDTVLASQVLDINLESIQSGLEDVGTSKLGLIKTVLPQGKYQLSLFHVDPVTNQKFDSVYYDFSTASFKQDKIALSDLELSSNIISRSQRKDATFYKNTMEVFPNPSRMFGKNNPRLYYYIEIYNAKGKNPTDEYQVQIAIADKEGTVRASKNYSRTQQYESRVERGAFDVSKLESGLYTLIYAVTNSVNNYAVYRRSNFLINNPNVLAIEKESTELFTESEFYDMPEDVVDLLFRQASYIATKSEQRIYSEIDTPDPKRRFLHQFWQTRCKQNLDSKADYYARVEYANEQFKAPGRDGWQTDMGRVYIVYGPPDNIERSPYDSAVKPYETWEYETLEGGTEFNFVDMSGYGDYQLVNSTVRSEIHDPNWQDYLR